MSRKTLAACLVGTMVFAIGAGSATAGRTLLVIPARYSVVQFAADITRLRPADMVAYDTRGEQGEVVVHFWEPSQQSWVLGSLDELRLGARFDAMPSRVVLIGGERDVPPAVLSAVSGLGTTPARVLSLRVVDMVNALNDTLKFTAGEWRWLAKRHQLETVDLNAERRRYGRYGSPGVNKTSPDAGKEDLSAAPVPVPALTPTPAVEAPDKPAAGALPAEGIRQPGPVEVLPEDK
jgi:hypothetical protein